LISFASGLDFYVDMLDGWMLSDTLAIISTDTCLNVHSETKGSIASRDDGDPMARKSDFKSCTCGAQL
jgi:hypothetical protein